jgi:TRAP transporter 4TM/12TM fusion protein
MSAAPDAAPEAAPLDLDDDERPARDLPRAFARAAVALGVGLSLYAVYWAVAVIETRAYRASFLLIALLLAFLLHPARTSAARLGALDLAPAALAVPAFGWMLLSPGFADRAATPGPLDLLCGVIALALVLEATRRCVGAALPLTALAFLAYAFAGPWLDGLGLAALAHRGYNLARVVGTLTMGLDGIFGVPLDVAATYVVLFALYAALLDASGAARFFLDWSFAVFGRGGGPAGPARTVTAAGFLLGTVSGSGVATTLALGAPGWPLLRRAGYPAESAGAILSAAGIGAILSPPTLGAAAFLIAEFLQVPYLRVLVMVTLPTLLYYLAVLLMAEAEARRLRLRAPAAPAASVGALTRRGGLHFLSLLAVAALMAAGLTPFRAVLLASLLAIATSFCGDARPLGPRRLLEALARGGRSSVAVTATTACAGVIVGVTALTGLGLKAAGLIVTLAGGNVLATVLLAAVAVWAVGLALPVTASYVLAAVMIAPALTQVGVPVLAAHLFIFYYAVLSEVSPPTALAPMAAAALTGGDPLRTVLHTWRYTLPAFLVPLAFTTSPEGLGLLLQGSLLDTLHAGLTAVLGIAALAAGLGGFLHAPATRVERTLATLGGVLLVLGSMAADLAGVACAGLALALHVVRLRPWRQPGDRERHSSAGM